LSVVVVLVQMSALTRTLVNWSNVSSLCFY
jgi:hypothetical protein